MNNLLETEKQIKQADLINLEQKYREKLDEKDELIARYKDMKSKLNNKLIGESLEQHCEIEFNKIRATAFPSVYFQKDNDSSSGTKGDYVFREVDAEGNEVISIMFEMKNEADDTNKKQKIDSF